MAVWVRDLIQTVVNLTYNNWSLNIQKGSLLPVTIKYPCFNTSWEYWLGWLSCHILGQEAYKIEDLVNSWIRAVIFLLGVEDKNKLDKQDCPFFGDIYNQLNKETMLYDTVSCR